MLFRNDLKHRGRGTGQWLKLSRDNIADAIQLSTLWNQRFVYPIGYETGMPVLPVVRVHGVKK